MNQERVAGQPLHMVAVVLLATLSLVACGGATTADNGEQAGDGAQSIESLEIATGPVGGQFYAIGSALASRLEEAMDIPVTAAPSGSSGQNVMQMSAGEFEIATIAANAVVPGFRGEEYFDQAHDEMRLITFLYPNALLLFTLEESGIETIEDLKGRRVGLGVDESTWEYFTRPLIEAHGLDYDSDITAVYTSFDDQLRQVRDGQLDAAISIGGANSPAPPILELAAERDIRLIEWDEAALDEALTDIEYMTTLHYPEEARPDDGEGDYVTPDLGGPYIVVRDDMPDDVAYQLTEVFHTSLDGMAEDIGVLRWVAEQPDSHLVTPLGDIPFHDGAIRYWQEAGVME